MDKWGFSGEKCGTFVLVVCYNGGDRTGAECVGFLFKGLMRRFGRFSGIPGGDWVTEFKKT